MSDSWFFVVVRPDSPPEMVGAAAEDVQAAISQLVGGPARRAVELRPDVVVWCSAKAERDQLVITRTIDGHILRGTLVVTGRPDASDAASAGSLAKETYRCVLRLFTEHASTISPEDVTKSFRAEPTFFARLMSSFGL